MVTGVSASAVSETADVLQLVVPVTVEDGDDETLATDVSSVAVPVSAWLALAV